MRPSIFCSDWPTGVVSGCATPMSTLVMPTAGPFAAVIDSAFLLVFAGVVWREVLTGRNWRNLPVCLLVSLLALANVAFHLDAQLWSSGLGERLALGAIGMLIALIGVANTLSLSAIERTRENSLMRALGLTRGGLRGMLALEAVLISGVAALIGSALGTVYGGLGAHTVFGPMAADIGQPVVWPAVPWLELALIVLVSVAAGLLASVAPSQRAARLSPVQGLAMA